LLVTHAAQTKDFPPQRETKSTTAAISADPKFALAVSNGRQPRSAPKPA
jgi:hypothetical protein